MAQATATICNKKGLHARAAAKLVKLASGFEARVTVTRLPFHGMPEASAGAGSILSLLMLSAENGSDVLLAGEGTQAEEAVAAMVALIGRRFDEEE